MEGENKNNIFDEERFQKYLLASVGYAELGMREESIAELDALPEPFQNRPEVLQLRLHHLMRKREWTQALKISQELCRISPDAAAGYLHAAFCLHQLGETRAAREFILHGPEEALQREPIYHYNMACYDAILGNVSDAQKHLKTSILMDESFKELARKDPDLKELSIEF